MFSTIFFIFLITNVQAQNINPLDLIKSIGYKGESHIAQTTDGYLLTIHRVLPKIIANVKKPPCLLLHGFSGTSLEYLQLKNYSLPFILANNGYDVYIGNVRGTKFSSHTKFSKKSSRFWDFSLHEIGFYDLSAMIDYVLHATKSQKLCFVGFSQGVAASMILLSSRPEYNQKIIKEFMLAPAVLMGNGQNSFIKFQGPFLVDIFARQNKLNLLPAINILKPFFKQNCKEGNQFGLTLCNLVIQAMAGGNIDNMEADLEVVRNMPHTSSPYASEKQARHFFQSAKTGKFQQYDYGDANMKVYGSKFAPDYDLSKVKIPIDIYGGGRDNVVDKKDVEILASLLQNVVDYRIIERFNHFDFMGSKRSVNEIYLRILNSLNSYR